jgi:hypothetical protein
MGPQRRHAIHPTAVVVAVLLLVAVPGGGPPAAIAGGLHAAVSSIVVTSPATGGASIPANRARVGGSGAWTDLHGLVLTEDSPTDLAMNDRIELELPIGFEWNPLAAIAPSVTGCELRSSSVTYPSADVASIRMLLGMGGPSGIRCRIAWQVLQVRPVSAAQLAHGGAIHIRIHEAVPAGESLLGVAAGTVGMAVTSPTYPAIVAATGAEAIPPSTAATGGSGAWTTLTGPVIDETADLQLLVGMTVVLTLPLGFEWDRAIDVHPQVTGCDRMLGGDMFQESARHVLFDVRDAPGWPGTVGRCHIDFGSVLLLRPLDASGAAGTGGTLVVTVLVPGQTPPVTLPGDAGRIAMAATPPPPSGSLVLKATSPYLNNGAIDWGRYVDLTTTATPGSPFQLQVTIDQVTWETLTDASGTDLKFHAGDDGTYTFRYRPVRNYWYRAVNEGVTSDAPRVTVRQTAIIRPFRTGTTRVASGTTISFAVTVRPARPELTPANVRFELYRRSGASWVLAQSETVAIDGAGVASHAFRFTSGRWRVRAQAQPTAVNANSFWTPYQDYTAG